jgi:hypothetical protein
VKKRIIFGIAGSVKFPVPNQNIFIISFPSLFFMRGNGKGLAAQVIGMVLVLALIAPVAADMMIREDATNRLGEDYTSIGLGTAGYDGTAESCSENCLHQPSCNAATFVEWDQSCWLKEIVPPATEESGMISFVRQKETPAVTVSAGAGQTVPAVSGGLKTPGFEYLVTLLGCLMVLMIRKSTH